jgi:hypothetical protein
MFLDALLAPVLERVRELISDLVSRHPRDVDPAGLGERLRAATFTPSPKMSSSSAITSPRLIPTRNSIRSSGGVVAFRSAIPR